MTSDFEELFACLSRHGVEAVVVGAHALAMHARPRYTNDLDVLVRPDSQNAARLLHALEEFGFGGLGISASDFDQPGRIVQLGAPPNRIDLITSIDGVSFDEVWNTRVEGHVGSQPAWFISRDALIRNKRASARPQDLADVDALERIR